MKNLTRVLSLGLLLGAGTMANAATVTEEYTGSQDLWEGDSYLFAFDLWNSNPSWLTTDSALHLTSDGTGATGPWSSAELYINFASVDSDREVADIDLRSWSFLFGSPLFSDQLVFNTPSGGSLTASYGLSSSQVNLLDNLGGGLLQISAPSIRGLENDFTITRVGLRATTAPVSAPEPSTLALFVAGLLALGALMWRGRRSMTAYGSSLV